MIRHLARLLGAAVFLAAALALNLACSTTKPSPSSLIDVKAYWPNPAMASTYRLTKLAGNHGGWTFDKLAADWVAFSITDDNCSVDYYLWFSLPPAFVESLVQPISTGSRKCPADGAEARTSVPPLLWMLPRFIEPAALPLELVTDTRDVLVSGDTASAGRTKITMRVYRDGELYAVTWRDGMGHGETLWAGPVPICGSEVRALGIVRYANTWGNDATYCWGQR